MAARSNHPASRALAADAGRRGCGRSPRRDRRARGVAGPGARVAARRADVAPRPPGVRRARHAGRQARARRGSPPTAGRSRAFAFDEEVSADVAAELAALSGARARRARALRRHRRPRCGSWRPPSGFPGNGPRAAWPPRPRRRGCGRWTDHDTLMVGDGINDAPSFAAAFCTATPAVDRPHLPARRRLLLPRRRDRGGAPRRSRRRGAAPGGVGQPRLRPRLQRPSPGACASPGSSRRCSRRC